MLWVRSLEHLNAQVLSGTEGVRFPFWSRDGRFIAFFAGGKLKKVDIFGAPPQTLCDVPDGHRDGLAVLREADPPAEEEDEILVDGALAAAAACAAISWRIRTSGPWS